MRTFINYCAILLLCYNTLQNIYFTYIFSISLWLLPCFKCPNNNSRKKVKHLYSLVWLPQILLKSTYTQTSPGNIQNLYFFYFLYIFLFCFFSFISSLCAVNWEFWCKWKVVCALLLCAFYSVCFGMCIIIIITV